MKKFKWLSYTFAFLAIILSDIMCGVVAYHYRSMQLPYQSAPAYLSLVYAIPFLLGIIVCVILTIKFFIKSRQ